MRTFKNEEIEKLQDLLTLHPIYNALVTLEDTQKFMEYHVFAVWDFMTLLKALQVKMTCTTIPWVPVGEPTVRQMINEIVLGEESDEVVGGLSHFEWYIQAMKEVGANTDSIDMLIDSIKSEGSYQSVIEALPYPVYQFVNTTMDIVNNGELHEIAAAFTIGRENLIPSMFMEFITAMKREHPDETATLQHYFERHIEVDGDSHGPLSIAMLNRLC
ncbi:MAG: DUF3050 domain-containing protein, partial [Kangiellaceae bacterium]|nr:DUF3050 domain-containing protein [Kangiellaceae bacterium]